MSWPSPPCCSAALWGRKPTSTRAKVHIPKLWSTRTRVLLGTHIATDKGYPSQEKGLRVISTRIALLRVTLCRFFFQAMFPHFWFYPLPMLLVTGLPYAFSRTRTHRPAPNLAIFAPLLSSCPYSLVLSLSN